MNDDDLGVNLKLCNDCLRLLAGTGVIYFPSFQPDLQLSLPDFVFQATFLLPEEINDVITINR